MSENKRYKQKVKLQIFAILVILSSLTGCWSSTEIDNLALVTVMSFDLNDTGDMEVTAVIPKPKALFSKMGGEHKNKSMLVTSTGKTIYETMNQLSSSIAGKIYFGHLGLAILGEKAARE